MAAVAAALLSYANYLEENNGRFKAAQIMLSLVFEYNLAIVALGILVPLLRKLWGKKESLTSPMLQAYGLVLFGGLLCMSVGFSLILYYKFDPELCMVYTICFTCILVGGSLLGLSH